MTDEQQLIADGLRDLHLPQPISGWPPAPGWWALLVVLLCVLAYALWRVVKRRQRSDPRRQAIAALSAAFAQWQADGNPASYLQLSHSILRRLAITLAGRTSVSRLSGDQWVDWLEQLEPQRSMQPFPNAVRDALARGAYQKTSTPSIALHHATYVNWVRNCRPPSSSISKTRNTIVTAQAQSSAGPPPVPATPARQPNA